MSLMERDYMKESSEERQKARSLRIERETRKAELWRLYGKKHKTIFVTVFFMLHRFSSYFLHKIGQAHNKEKANGSKNNCGQTNVHFLLCDFSF